MGTRKCGCKYSDSRDWLVKAGYMLSGVLTEECKMHRTQREAAYEERIHAPANYTEKAEAYDYANALMAELLRKFADRLQP